MPTNMWDMACGFKLPVRYYDYLDMVMHLSLQGSEPCWHMYIAYV